MAEEKVTEMLLKVDLDCYSCYKKIKKTLCKFPQIRDQIYDEKNNTVKITVVCCSPEKIRDKLCCRGGSSIKSIEILEPSKPKPTEPEKKKEAEKPKPQQKEPDQKPKQLPEKPKESEKPKDNGKPKASEKPKEVEKPKDAEKPKPKEADKPQPPPQAAVPMPVQPPKQPEPVHNVPVPVMMATQACPMELYSSCGQCYGGGGPCCHGYGIPVAPPQCYDNRGNIYGYPYGNGGGYYGYNNNNQRCHLDRCCDYYLSEENPSSCAIM